MKFQVAIESDEGVCKRALDDTTLRMQDAIDILNVSFDRVEAYKVHIGDMRV